MKDNELIEYTTISLISYWDTISRLDKNYKLINNLLKIININLNKISKLWKMFIKKNLLNNNTIFVHNKFLKMVLNDNNYHNKNSEMNNYRNYTSDLYNNSNNLHILSDYVNYINQGYKYILCNGDINNLGNVISVNNGFCMLFGYLKSELLKNNLNILLPDMFISHHNNMLYNSLKYSLNNVSKEFTRIYSLGLHSNGYVFPVNLSVSVLNGIEKIYLLAFAKGNDSTSYKNSSCHFITDLDFKVQKVSSECNILFNINNNNFINNSNGNLDLSLIINDVNKLKNNIDLIDEYNNDIISYTRKTIIIDNLTELNKFLLQNNENNRKVRLNKNYRKAIYNKCIKNIKNINYFNLTETFNNLNVCNNSNENKFNNLSLVKYHNSFNNYYVTIKKISFNNNAVIGYHVILDLIKNDKLYNYVKEYSDKLIKYESKILNYDVNNSTLFNPYGKDVKQLSIVTNKSILNQNILKKGISPEHKDSSILYNSINYYLKKNKIKDFSNKITLKVIDFNNKIFKKKETNKTKIYEVLYTCECMIKNNKDTDKSILLSEEVYSNNIYVNSNNIPIEIIRYLDFNGIDGWKEVSKIIRNNPLPYEIKLLSIVSVLFYLCQFALGFWYKLYFENKYTYLKEIVNIHNTTTYSSFKIIEVINMLREITEINEYQHVIEFANSSNKFNKTFDIEDYVYFKSKEDFIIANETIYYNLNCLLNSINDIKNSKLIVDNKLGYNNTYEYIIDYVSKIELNYLNNTDIVESTINVNYIQSLYIIINNVFDIMDIYAKNTNTLYYTEEHLITYKEYLILYDNIVNKYLQYYSFINTNIIKEIIEFESSIKNKLIIAFLMSLIFFIPVTILLYLTNSVYNIYIKYIDLFYTLPNKTCWKYYSKCEVFLSFFKSNKCNNINRKNDNNFDYSNLITEQEYNYSNNSENNNYINNTSNDKLFSKVNNENNLSSLNKIKYENNNSFKIKKILYFILIGIIFLNFNLSMYFYNYYMSMLHNNEFELFINNNDLNYKLYEKLNAIDILISEEQSFNYKKAFNISKINIDKGFKDTIIDSYKISKQKNINIVKNKISLFNMFDEFYYTLNSYGLCYGFFSETNSNSIFYEYNINKLNKYNINKSFLAKNSFLKFINNDVYNNLNLDVELYKEINYFDVKLANQLSNLCYIVPENYKTFSNMLFYYLENSSLLYNLLLKSRNIEFFINNEFKVYFHKNLFNSNWYNLKAIKNIIAKFCLEMHQYSINKTNYFLDNLINQLFISYLLYCIISVLIYLVLHFAYVDKIKKNIINTKISTILIDSNDVKDSRIIINFLIKEINQSYYM